MKRRIKNFCLDFFKISNFGFKITRKHAALFQLVLLSCCGEVVLGQGPDSLLSAILNEKNDTQCVNRLYKHGFSIRQSNPQLAANYAQHCHKKALITHSKKHIAKSYNLLGVLAYRKGNFKDALDYHRKALLLRTECNDILGIAHSQTNLGNIYSDYSLFAQAESAYLQAMEAYTKLNDRAMTANSLVNLGVLTQQMKQPDKANEYYKLALDIANELNDYDIKSLCLSNMAVVFFDKGDYESAIGYSHDALKVKQLMDEPLLVANSHLNLADAHIKLNQFSQARLYLDEAYATAIKNDFFEVKQSAAKIYATYFAATKNFEEAFKWQSVYYRLNDSIQLNEQLQQKKLPEFEDLKPLPVAPKTKYNNLWLFLTLIILVITIPFYLFQFKR